MVLNVIGDAYTKFIKRVKDLVIFLWEWFSTANKTSERVHALAESLSPSELMLQIDDFNTHITGTRSIERQPSAKSGDRPSSFSAQHRYCLQARIYLHLRVNFFLVASNRFIANKQGLCYLAGGISFGQIIQNLKFTRS